MTLNTSEFCNKYLPDKLLVTKMQARPQVTRTFEKDCTLLGMVVVVHFWKCGLVFYLFYITCAG